MTAADPGVNIVDSADDVDAVAVVGMAVRFPGAHSVEQFWANLCGGVESIRRFTPEQLAAAGVPGHLQSDGRYVPARGVIGDADLFDADYFGMSAREAELTDPQQRLFLECAEEALQDAGYDATRLRSAVGVFAGSAEPSYLWMMQRLAPEREIDPLLADVGNEAGFLAARVAYKLNLSGPAFTVQSACSTGLVAIHLACQSLLDGECSTALAGASRVFYPEETGYLYQPGSIASPDGHCRAFDAAANGTVYGNGSGVVVLKLLSQALQDGDDIRCLVLGSAVNNDGAAKVGFTAPGVRGQRAVIRRAIAVAGVPAHTIRYVEAHGTGTALGDPVEVSALAQALGEPGASPRLIGSVKPNVGHLDTAAGLAGFVKAALVVQRGLIPPTLHFRAPNPEAQLPEQGFEVAARLTRWPSADAPRRAGVSSFGAGGTNAHAILQEPPQRPATVDADEPAQLLVLSAATPAVLDRLTGELARYLAAPEVATLPDIAYTLQMGRRAMVHRLAVAASTVEEARRALATRARPAIATGRWSAGTEPRVAFVLPARVTHDAAMVTRLATAQTIFAEHLRACRAALPGPAGDAVAALLTPEPSEAPDPAALEAVRFATQYALVRTWQALGVRPSYLAGTSAGALAAATVAGVFALDDAGRVAGQLAAFAAAEPTVARAALDAVLRTCALHEPSIPLVVAAGGARVGPAEAVSPSYWSNRLCPGEPDWSPPAIPGLPVDVVLDVAGVADLATVEVRAGAGAPGAVRLTHRPGANLPEVPAELAFARVAGHLWAGGVALNWAALHTGRRRRRVPLPTYPFDRARFSLLPASAPVTAGPQRGPEPLPSRHPRPDLDTPYTPPAAGLQSYLAGVFEEVLGVAGLGANDSFFELGGDSLMAIQVLSRIHERYAVDLPEDSLFTAATVAGVAKAVDGALEDAVARMTPAEVANMLRQMDGNHVD
jgi:acyl transferase domain-containing protein/acyl carrier protein